MAAVKVTTLHGTQPVQDALKVAVGENGCASTVINNVLVQPPNNKTPKSKVAR